MASSKGFVAIVKVLINAGGNVNQARTDTGASPLWMASQNGNVDKVKELIKAGSNVNQARETDGVSPLMVASQEGHAAIGSTLLYVLVMHRYESDMFNLLVKISAYNFCLLLLIYWFGSFMYKNRDI